MAHLTDEQRYTIEVSKAQNKTNSEIATLIGKHKSTIGRELNRNSDNRSGSYRYTLASRKSDERKKNKRKAQKLTPEMLKMIISYLEEGFSPEQISGYCKKNNIECVCYETIYQHIWLDKSRNGKLHTFLRRNGRKYRKRGNSKDSRGSIKNRICISTRPEIIKQRSRFGDLEIDLIIGENHNQAILTIVDRVTGMLKMKKVESKEASVVTAATNSLLEDCIPYLYIITADNGKEFAGHEEVAETLGIDYYFAHPYHSWERGTNENCNGLIRQYFKKGSSLVQLTDQDIKTVEGKLNNRPRKRLGYENPIFAMNQILYN